MRGSRLAKVPPVVQRISAYRCSRTVGSVRQRTIEAVYPDVICVVAINGEIVGLDLVDLRDTFKDLWEMLIRGYALDAVLEPQRECKPLTSEDVEYWFLRR